MPKKKKEPSISKEALSKAKNALKDLYPFLSVDSLTEVQIIETLINYCKDKVDQDKLGQQSYILTKAQEIINLNPHLLAPEPVLDAPSVGVDDVIVA